MAYSDRGAAYASLGKCEDAIGDFAKGIHLDPNLTDPYYNWGIVSHHLGNYQQAIRAFESYLQLAPSDAESGRTQAQQYIDEMLGQQ